MVINAYLPRFHVLFWLSHIFIYFTYVLASIEAISIMYTQGYG